jgi:pimeloyl-ACP methyl ester carboxylesterase
VFFVIGTEDIAAPMEDLLQQVHLPRVSDIHILNGVGHMSMLESPKELNKKLLHFLKLI